MQTDFESGNWNECINQIQGRLEVTNNDQMIVIGLRALREFVRAFQDEIDEKRKPLINVF